MPSNSALINQTLTEFSEALAARTATPGGGSMAAFLAAAGAALVGMACRFTDGEKYASVGARMADAAARLDRLRPSALALVDRDAAAYDAVTAAFALPKSSEEQKLRRSAAIQTAMKGALEVPFETMQVALAGLEIAAPIAPELNPNLASDCGVGARCLHAALESAFLNVRINAQSIKDAAFAADRMQASEAARARAEVLFGTIARALEPRR